MPCESSRDQISKMRRSGDGRECHEIMEAAPSSEVVPIGAIRTNGV